MQLFIHIHVTLFLSDLQGHEKVHLARAALSSFRSAPRYGLHPICLIGVSSTGEFWNDGKRDGVIDGNLNVYNDYLARGTGSKGGLSEHRM